MVKARWGSIVAAAVVLRARSRSLALSCVLNERNAMRFLSLSAFARAKAAAPNRTRASSTKTALSSKKALRPPSLPSASGRTCLGSKRDQALLGAAAALEKAVPKSTQKVQSLTTCGARALRAPLPKLHRHAARPHF